MRQRLRSKALAASFWILAIPMAILAPACRRAHEQRPPEGPRFSDTTLSLPTIPPLADTTPASGGLVASILTPRAAEAATTPSLSDWAPRDATLAAAGRMVWAKDFAQGYRDAVLRNKGMVVVFGQPGQAWYEKVIASFESPAMSALADQAIWIRADPTQEIMAKNVCTALGVEHLPTISVLDPDPEILSEESRIEGFEEPEKLARDLDIPLKRANGRLPRVPTRAP